MKTRMLNQAELLVLATHIADRTGAREGRQAMGIEPARNEFDTAQRVTGWPDDELQDYADSYAARHPRTPVWLTVAGWMGLIGWVVIGVTAWVLWGPEL